MNELNERLRQEVSRRTFLVGVGAAGVGTAAATLLSGCGSGNRTTTIATPTPIPTATPTPVAGIGDSDIFNFALNFEYLGAEYYARGLTGQGLSSGDTGSNPGTVTGGRAVSFTNSYVQQIVQQFAADELGHVRTFRTVLGSAAVSRPALDFTNSFNALARLAGIGNSFDPFASEDAFLLGAFIFEEVDVSAFIGAAPLLTSSANLAAAGSMLGTEAYHGGTLRTLIYNTGNQTYINDASNITGLRESVGGGTEQPLTGSTIVPTNGNSIIGGRTTGNVLRIAYGTQVSGTTSGGFFPSGVNGRIRAAA